jgi:hypothetical protein
MAIMIENDSTSDHRDQLLTAKQLAEALHVGPRTPELWRQRGDGPPYYRPGGKKVLYRWSDVLKWLETTKASNTAHEAA